MLSINPLISTLVFAVGFVDAAAVAAGNTGDHTAPSLTNSTKPAASATKAAASSDDGETENWRLSRSMVWSWIVLVGLLMIYVCALWITRYMRTIVCFPTNNQEYFSIPNHWHSRFLKHFYQAPLFKKRHHREFQISKAINVGTLPSRSQTFFLLGYLAMAVTLTVYGLDWSGPMSPVLSEIISRTGYMGRLWFSLLN
jgi:hypothetical protein